MKYFCSIIILICLSCNLSAQVFTGKVKKNGRPPTDVYQAKVEIKIGDKTVKILKTYFDGVFSFKPDKNRTYTVTVSYPGYIDSTFTFSTDKDGVPDPPSANIRLNKNGMRLYGFVLAKKDNFPLKNVSLVLRNIMTKQTDRVTTGLDGSFNFKIEAETNYSFSVDKRSSGVVDKYKDTTIYITTLGWSRQIDYNINLLLPVFKAVPINKHRAELEAAKLKAKQNAELALAAKKRKRLSKKKRLAQEAAVVQDSINREKAARQRELEAQQSYQDSVVRAGYIEQQKNLILDSAKLEAKKPASRKLPHIDLPPLFFGKNSFDLNETVQKKLEGLANLLAINSTWRLNLFSLASADENNKEALILKRCDAIMEFLLKAGINPLQLQALYYGADKSLTDCNQPDCPEKQLARNRCAVGEIVKN